MPNSVGNPVQGCPGKEEEEKEEKKPELHFIKFQVNDETGKPLPGVKLHVVLPDGSREEKTSDDKGLVEINNLKPGNCSIDMDYDDHVLHETVFIH